MDNASYVSSWAGYRAGINSNFSIEYYQSYDSTSQFNYPPVLRIVLIKDGDKYEANLSVDDMHKLQEELDQVLALERAARRFDF